MAGQIALADACWSYTPKLTHVLHVADAQQVSSHAASSDTREELVNLLSSQAILLIA